MLNFYKIVKENLSFNRFQYKDNVCLEYTCPIDAERIGIFSRNDYVVYVLSGKKTYTTINGEWTVSQGQTLFLKKGAEVIRQFFDSEYCMLGFFLTDDLIKETFSEVQGNLTLHPEGDLKHFTAARVNTDEYLEGYFHSMLTYFRSENRPPDHIMALKIKELLITIMNSDPLLAGYFKSLSQSDRPSIRIIMENNFCYSLKLEDYATLCHRSLSSFKREFKELFNDTPGRWIVKRRVERSAHLLINSDLSISQVGFESGFEDLSHFSRAFKTQLGVSPTDYKKQLAKG